MKSNRQSIILELISQEDIETQGQLMEALARVGVEATQATLSRDIRALHLVKELSPAGVYRYTLPKTVNNEDNSKLQSIFRQCVVRVDVAQNLLVLHTLPGLANGAASALDQMDIPALVGSLAGDDTAFFAMRTEADAEELCRSIKEML